MLIEKRGDKKETNFFSSPLLSLHLFFVYGV